MVKPTRRVSRRAGLTDAHASNSKASADECLRRNLLSLFVSRYVSEHTEEFEQANQRPLTSIVLADVMPSQARAVRALNLRARGRLHPSYRNLVNLIAAVGKLVGKGAARQKRAKKKERQAGGLAVQGKT